MSSTEGSVDSSCVSGDRSRHRQEAASTETSSDPASSTGIVPVPQPPLVDESDPLSSHYGDLAFWCLKEKVLAKKVDIASLETVLDGAVISLRARLHSKTFGRNNRLNLVLRKQFHKVTCRLWAEHSGVSEAMVKYGRTLTNDSVLEIEGEVKVSRLEEGSISIKKEIEIYIKKIYCLSRAKSLPFNLDDASAPEVAAEVNPRPRVSQPTRLNYRIVDLCTPANQAIFIIQSRVEQLLRQFLMSEGFVGIHTPKILAGASDGGASVFTLRYKEMDASLAQSAQLHKQMAICSDFKHVFEAAASFGAESSKTNRHLCEFIQFVVEMEIEETYLEVINLVDRLFVHVFNELNHSCRDLIEIVDKQHCGRRFKYLDKTPCISFQRAVEMLKDAGLDINPFGDLNRESERKLGELMLKEYDTDFFIVDRFPLVVRPFCTMACPYDKNYSNSLNVFMRGRRRKEIKEMKIIKMYKEIQFPYIPEEIILLILSKLPVKSLLRFRCVSKSWLSLISDPKFTLATQRRQVIILPEYNRMSMAHHSYRTGYYPDYYRPKFSIKLINDEASVKQLPEPEPLRMIRSKLQCLVRMRGSCNGLLLVSVCEDLFLWNPSTRSCNLVLSHYHLSEAKQEYLDLTVSGLCYDSSTDDYKALMAICDVDNSITDFVVGSLRNKTWTQIHFPYDKYGAESGPLVNEHLHWLVSDSSCTSEDHHRFFTSALVVYFDQFTNEFVKVPMPPQLEEERINVQYTILGLGILDGCLSMVLSRKELGGKHDLEVLTMKKYGEKASWTSLFNISDYFRGFDVDEYHLVPLCFTKNRDDDDDDDVVLMFLTEDESLLTCNPKQNSCSDFCIPNRSTSINAAMFVESLVSPSTYMWEDEEYMEIFLSGETIKWKRNKDMKIKYDMP